MNLIFKSSGKPNLEVKNIWLPYKERNRMLRKIPFLLLRLTGIPFFVREVIQRKKVTIVLFHDISPDRVDMHLRVLRSKYNIISLQDYVRAKEAGRVDELPPKSLIITLDDGHKSNYELKPLLERYDVPATIFLCSGIVDTKRHFWWYHKIGNDYSLKDLKNIPNKERLEILRGFEFEETKEFDDRQALSKNEIEDMKLMVDFQSHTVFHPVLPNCATEEAYKEISQSKKDLEEMYGLKIYALSYPMVTTRIERSQSLKKRVIRVGLPLMWDSILRIRIYSNLNASVFGMVQTSTSYWSKQVEYGGISKKHPYDKIILYRA